MKKFTLLVGGLIVLVISVFSINPPDEGMWLPMFVDRLNYTDMHKMGLNLTAEEIYSINNSSLKDAVVGLSYDAEPRGYFCTGEIVSEQGLLFTNHHCGYDIIQQHSSVEHDYLTDGFWAYSMSEELSNEELTASFLLWMDNVTDSIIPFLSDTMSEGDRRSKVGEIIKRLESAVSEDGKYHVVVSSFFGGNEYYRFVYQVYKDVRLVGAPPSSIGKFGGDTDNWMWPRHTGDFSIFRVYSAPDGTPATFSTENIPLKPKHHLPVSLKGVNKDDFAMIWGYPGNTNRYSTSYGVEFTVGTVSPTLIGLFGKTLEIMKEDMDSSNEVKIKYASNYAGIANTWKNFIGQVRGVKRLKVIDRKREIEKEFQEWINADESRTKKYGSLFRDIEAAYKDLPGSFTSFVYLTVGLLGPGILEYSQEFTSLEQQLKEIKDNPAAPVETAKTLRESAKEHFKNYNAPTDQKLMAGLYAMYGKDIPLDQQVGIYKELSEKCKGDYEKFASELFENSIFSNEAKVNAFLDNPSAKKLAKDPAYILGGQLTSKIMELSGGYRKSQSKLSKYNRLFIDGLRQMYPDKVFYPDANSTMRLSYGSIEDYYPADAVHYDYVTYLSGVMEKEDPSNDEFIVPQKLKELFVTKDYGRYGKDGKLITCFLSTNDITGGNSGSPVINGNGELIGLAFDGNWEAMSGDIAFEPELQRTICVDIRYVMFIIDKFAGAKNLIDELTIVY